MTEFGGIGRAFRRYFIHAWAGVRRREAVFLVSVLFLTGILAAIPSGFEKETRSVRARALVLATDDSGIKNYGILMQGEQALEVRILSGPHAGLEVEAENFLFGKMDSDTVYRPGDTALVVIDTDESGRVIAVAVRDQYRLGAELFLALVFAALLLLYGGWTGLKTLAAFVFSAVGIWKLLIPAILAGYDPVLSSFGLIVLLILVIVYLVAGFTLAGTAAALGSLWGSLVSGAIGLLMAHPFHLNGAVRPFSETLLYGGFDNLNLRSVFLAGTFLACSGALIDLAIDVSVAMEEVHAKRPELGFFPLLSSGLSVGRKVFGTMTTTLLLAYSGGFTSLLMVFMAKGVPFDLLFNLNYVSSEIFQTLVGSLGLVLVAPFTAVSAAFLFSRKNRLSLQKK